MNKSNSVEFILPIQDIIDKIPSAETLISATLTLPKKKDDNICQQFRKFAKEQISTNKRPMSSKELLDALLEIDPNFHKEIKAKCEDYSRIVLSQSKSLFNKFKRKEPEPGIDRRTLFYGLTSEIYDLSQWIPVGKNEQSNTFSLAMDLQNIPELKPSSFDVDSSSSLSGIVLNALPTFNLNDSEYHEAKDSWKTLIDSIPQTDLLWSNILDAVDRISRDILSGKDLPDMKTILSEANINLLPPFTSLIEKIMQNEIDYRRKLLGK